VRRAAVAFLVVFVLAGCSSLGGDSGSVEREELPGLVLQQADLPREFAQFDEGEQALTDTPGGRRADPGRFGREAGWKARYRRAGSRQTVGALVVESRADLFETAGGAEDDLGAAREEVADADLEWMPIDEPGLGQESFAATVVLAGVRYYKVFWRDANVTASLDVNGFKLALGDVLALARKQERRIADAT
jgi:hypothetical protein